MKIFLSIYQKILVIGGVGVALFVSLYVFAFDGDMNKMKNFKDKLLRKKVDKDKGNEKIPKEKKESKQKNNKESKEGSKGKGSIVLTDSRDFLDFDEVMSFSVQNPMGLVILKGRKEFVGYVEVRGVNYNLLSIAEREILEESFGKLLNGIDYANQIYLQTRKIDIESYIYRYTSRVNELKTSIDRMKSRLEFLYESSKEDDSILLEQRDLNRLIAQYNYGVEINKWIIERCSQKSMLEKKYYIVISHKHNTTAFEEELTEKELIHNAFFDISNKGRAIISALEGAELGGKILTGFEACDLLYRSYNKSESENYKLERAIKSRFSHLYTTSEPVELKRLKRQAKEIDEEIKELENKKKVGA